MRQNQIGMIQPALYNKLSFHSVSSVSLTPSMYYNWRYSQSGSFFSLKRFISYHMYSHHGKDARLSAEYLVRPGSLR